jgi:hypothetical protein
VALSEKLGLVAQYYNALTSDIQAVPTTDEHRELMRRYEGLVGHPQMLCGNYSEAAGRSPAAKMLLLTRDPDALMQTVQEQVLHLHAHTHIYIHTLTPHFNE